VSTSQGKKRTVKRKTEKQSFATQWYV